MHSRDFGVFFLKIFFTGGFLFSCGQKTDKPAPYAETRFLPASALQTIQLESNQTEPLVLEGAQQKLLDDLFDDHVLEKTLVATGRESRELKKIKSMLWGEIVNGSVCLRFYSPDSDFTVHFLWQWLSIYETEKNRVVEQECQQKINTLEKELGGITEEQSRIKDSLNWVKDKYGLLISPEEITRAMNQGTYQPDSAGIMAFNLLQARFSKTFELYARAKQKKDDVQTDRLAQSLRFYIVDAPHFVKAMDKDH